VALAIPRFGRGWHGDCETAVEGSGARSRSRSDGATTDGGGMAKVFMGGFGAIMVIGAFILLTTMGGGGEPERSLRTVDGGMVAAIQRHAEAGSASAQAGLGYLYANGLGVPKAESEAVKWYRRAAEQDNPDAQVFLGVMYATGDGVERDFVESHVWLTLAADALDPGDTRDLAVKSRDIVAAKLTPAQRAASERRLRLWTANHAG